jgi:hypothetical protein
LDNKLDNNLESNNDPFDNIEPLFNSFT